MNWENAIKEFKMYLKLEKKMQDNSIEAYLNDVRKFYNFINVYDPSIQPHQVNTELLKDFIYQISEYVSPHTQARLISGLRSFFHFLVLEDQIKPILCN